VTQPQPDTYQVLAPIPDPEDATHVIGAGSIVQLPPDLGRLYGDQGKVAVIPSAQPQ